MGRAPTPDQRHGRVLFPGARGTKPLMRHGRFQPLLDGAAVHIIDPIRSPQLLAP